MTAPDTSRLIMLPGLGADKRQFEPQCSVFPNIETPAWLPHDPADTLRGYAQRMEEIIEPTAPYYIGGSSFGGMIAQELAAILDPQPNAVLLVASASKGDQIAPHLRYFTKFASVLPERVFEAGKGFTSLYASKFGRLTPDQKDMLAAMVDGATPAFVRWGIGAITAWEGAGELSMPVHHVHGADDELIPADRVAADLVIPGGGHLVNVTHADEVNTFFAGHINHT